VKDSEFFYLMLNGVLPVAAISTWVLTAARGVKTRASVSALVPLYGIGWSLTAQVLSAVMVLLHLTLSNRRNFRLEKHPHL
jgi:hypothetical protein